MATINYKIRENSWLAAIAARKLKTGKVAMVLGRTIHLHNTSAKDFLQDRSWLKHELCHIEQFRRFGFFMFLIKYLYQSIRHGYYYNKYEIEAREAENK
ncbi:MAG: DUF4157 domain-containing protein [Ferruginibacter sp.]